MAIDAEEWADIPGFEGYYRISTLSRVISVKRTVRIGEGYREVNPVILKQRLNKYGYYCVYFSIKRKGYLKTVHRLMSETFIDNPNGHPEVNHINGIKTDNRISNLEWCTSEYNHDHATKNGLKIRGEKQGLSKLTDDDIRKILELRSSGETMKSISGKFDVVVSTICEILTGKTWNHITGMPKTEWRNKKIGKNNNR